MSAYTLGPATWRRVPRLRTKPSCIDRHGRRDSGGGYERIRSYEERSHTPGEDKEDVYVAHHRLLAVVACYPDDMAVSDILAHLDGRDVHHSAPEVEEDWGVEWDNRPECLHVVEHGRHSEITQAQMRAWAADDRETARQVALGETPQDRCGQCGEPARTLAESADWSGVFCLDCAAEASDGATIEVR